MPALITHYLFGEEALKELPGAQDYTAEQRNAFLLGCQGPDPFFFSAISRNSAAAHRFGSISHTVHIARELEAYHDALDYLTDSDKNVVLPYVLGFLAHYTLDVNAHPFVYAQQYELMDAYDALAEAHSQVHAVIESDIDSELLQRMRGTTVPEFHPGTCLVCSRESLDLIGKVHAYVAKTVYHIPLSVHSFTTAVRDMRGAYFLIESKSGRRGRTMGRAERLFKKHSILASLAHRAPSKLTRAAVNDEHKPWTNPFTHEQSAASFEDLFDAALDEYRANVRIFLAGGPMQEISCCRNFNGSPLSEDETEVLGDRRPH